MVMMVVVDDVGKGEGRGTEDFGWSIYTLQAASTYLTPISDSRVLPGGVGSSKSPRFLQAVTLSQCLRFGVSPIAHTVTHTSVPG